MITQSNKQRALNRRATTIRHRIALAKLLENGGKSVGKALIEAGYSIPTAKNPDKVLTSKGFRSLLHSHGLTEDLVSESLVDDIKNKPEEG